MIRKSVFILSVLFVLTAICVSAQKNGETYHFESAIAGKYMDVQWAKDANGTPLHLWPFNGKVAQQFKLEDARNGYFYIKSALGKYLHVEGASNDSKIRVVIWQDKGADNTKWKFVDAGNGYKYIQSKLGNNLDVQWAAEKDGTPIWMWPPNQGKAQKWKLQPFSNNTTGDIEIVKIKNFGEGCFNTLDGHSKNNITDIGSATDARVEMKFELINNSIRAFATVTMGRTKSIKATWSRVIYSGGNKEIVSFDPTYSSGTRNFKKTHKSQSVVFEIPKGGFEFGGCNDGNIKTVKTSYGLIKIIGDTGGSDISDDYDCSCDSKLVDILFKDMAIKYKDDRQKECEIDDMVNQKPNYEFTIFEPGGFEFSFTGKDKFNPNDFEVFLKPNKRYRYKLRFFDSNGLKNVIFQTSSKNLRLSSSSIGSGWEFNQSGFGYEYRWNGDKNNKECEVSFLGLINFNESDIDRNEVFIINIEDFNGDSLYHQSDVTIPIPKALKNERVRYFNNFK